MIEFLWWVVLGLGAAAFIAMIRWCLDRIDRKQKRKRRMIMEREAAWAEWMNRKKNGHR
jgi:hypothetical protein